MSADHAEERRALLAASDAALAPRRDPRNWRTEHDALQAGVVTRCELARAHRRAHARAMAAETARIAPAPTGSREIPSWLLAVLIVLAITVVTLTGCGGGDPEDAPAAAIQPPNCKLNPESCQ